MESGCKRRRLPHPPPRAFRRATFPRKTCLCKFNVTTQSVINTRGASDLVCGRPDGIDLSGENKLLDFLLDLVIQLVTVVSKKFDAVVLIRIMRSRKDDTGVRAQRARDVSNAGCWQRPDDQNIYSEGSDSGHQRVFEHVTGKTRVF